MKRLAYALACLTAWLVLTAPQGRADVATLYSQNFSAGASTFEAVPYFNIYASGGGPTESPDSLYPALTLAHGSRVTSMTGPGGGTVNVMDRNPAWDGGPDEFDYQGLASEWRSALVPSWGTLTDGMFSMRKLRISMDLYLPTEVISDAAFTLVPFQLISHPTPSVWNPLFDVYLYKNNFPSTVYGLQVNSYWDADYVQTISAPSVGWHTLVIELQVQSHTATSATTWTNTASDGTFKLYWDGALIFDKSGLTDMFWYMRSSEPAASGFSIGYYGVGAWTNLVITDGATGSPSLTVPSATLWLRSDPADIGAEFLPAIGDSFGPLIWAEWSGSDGDRRYWAPVDLPDPASYYGGYKSPKLLNAGLVTRALSDEDGNLQSQKFDVTASDIDRDVRALLGQSDNRRHIFNTLLVLRMISDPDRRALLTPRTVAIGVVREYELG